MTAQNVSETAVKTAMALATLNVVCSRDAPRPVAPDLCVHVCVCARLVCICVCACVCAVFHLMCIIISVTDDDAHEMIFGKVYCICHGSMVILNPQLTEYSRKV